MEGDFNEAQGRGKSYTSIEHAVNAIFGTGVNFCSPVGHTLRYVLLRIPCPTYWPLTSYVVSRLTKVARRGS